MKVASPDAEPNRWPRYCLPASAALISELDVAHDAHDKSDAPPYLTAGITCEQVDLRQIVKVTVGRHAFRLFLGNQ